MPLAPYRSLRVLPCAVLLALAAACGPDASNPSRSPLAEKWLTRAKQSYEQGDFEDAKVSSDQALQASQSDNEIRLMGAKMALLRLDFDAALKLTEGLTGTEAAGIRGRAHWYKGNVEAAADALEAMLTDPAVKDPWARDVARLARKGALKKPYTIEGQPVAQVPMPDAGPLLVVPCELEGERILAVVATATPDVVLDSSSRKEPAWVDIRFGELTDQGRGSTIEVRDVPATTHDLSALSRQLGTSVKALLGVNLLRKLHVTFDRRGDQFVARTFEPPPPPDGTRVPVHYLRGGGPVVRAQIGPKESMQSSLFLDTVQSFWVALSDDAWKSAGVDLGTLRPDPGGSGAKVGRIPRLKMGGFDLPDVPGVAFGASLSEVLPPVDTKLGGIVGGSMLSVFRVTFADDGKNVWLEPDPTLLMPNGPPPGPAAQGMPGPLPPEGERDLADAERKADPKAADPKAADPKAADPKKPKKGLP